MLRISYLQLILVLFTSCGSSSGFIGLNKQETADYIEVKTFFNATDPQFEEPDQYPMYPGGLSGLLDDIATRLRYPEEVQALGIEGTVLASYMIDTDGSIKDVIILQSISPDLDAEVQRAIAGLKAWRPAMKNGEAIRTGLIQPFNFSID